jgi:hypothetical protein
VQVHIMNLGIWEERGSNLHPSSRGLDTFSHLGINAATFSASPSSAASRSFSSYFFLPLKENERLTRSLTPDMVVRTPKSGKFGQTSRAVERQTKKRVPVRGIFSEQRIRKEGGTEISRER